MRTRRGLERALEAVEGFPAPRADLEQYLTPPTVAASLVHEADVRGDLDRRVVDLGTGTGMLAIAAALRGADTIGLEVDPAALAVAQANANRLAVAVDWVRGDAASVPLCLEGATVVSNPPFGAQRANRGADRAFLAAAAALAEVSYTIHTAASRSFVAAFAADAGGRVTDAYAVELDVPAQFAFHEEAVAAIEAKAYRIEWSSR